MRHLPPHAMLCHADEGSLYVQSLLTWFGPVVMKVFEVVAIRLVLLLSQRLAITNVRPTSITNHDWYLQDFSSDFKTQRMKSSKQR